MIHSAADGPRRKKEGEKEKTELVRKICANIDWECNIRTLYRNENLGCKEAVSNAISWFFENEEMGIILEDDCLPDHSFFFYCQELLEKYKNDTRIMSISGVNFQKEKLSDGYSYYFSRYVHIWGWATWRRAWNYYDKEMKLWPVAKENHLIDRIVIKKSERKYWNKYFNLTYKGQIDTWDYQWTFTCWMQSGLSIIPATNLVRNIGFGPAATHTKELNIFSNMTVVQLNFPLVYPEYVLPNKIADNYTSSLMFTIPCLLNRGINRIIKKLSFGG